MTLRVRSQQPGRSLGVLILFLVVVGSPVALASRPLDHAAQSQQQQQQHKDAQHIQQLTQQVASSVNSLNRQLRQSATCPEGCDIGGAVSYCQQDSTSGALRCSKCLGNLFVNKADGTCVCPPGKFSDGNATCKDCPKGSWCPGGKFSVSSPPPKVDCPQFMTTLGLRAVSARSCVNMPGYSYAVSATGQPSATVCPENTYGPGLKKQRACVPCVPGFSTVGVTGARVPTACVVPPGYFLKGPRQVAPCPPGEWKAGIGTDGNCTRCAMGVTTLGPAATSESNCTILAAGYYAKQMRDGIVTQVAVCPQNFYCSGGIPVAAFDPRRRLLQAAADDTIKRCPDGTWTQNVGASTVEQCLTPPGYKTANGTTVPCGPNEFRAEWKPAAQAPTCQSCGVGVNMTKTDRITVYDPADPTNETQIAVATSADDCFIQAGQGLLYQTLDNAWRAVNCDSNNYGVANVTYGLTAAPCRTCPENMVTSKNKVTYPRSASWYHRNADGSGGFVSNLACVTQAGWGYNGRNSYKCDKGTYNGKDTYSDCTRCKYGMTTAGLGAGVKESDCGIAPGFGYETGAYYNMTIMECPIGKYNDKIQYVRTTPCTDCPIGTTNDRTGADSKGECDKCLGGWGFKDCATQCGGGIGSNATYGPPGRDYGSPCISCNNILTTYSYSWMTDNDVWSAPVTARLEADSAVDCLAEFTQLVDGAFYIPALDLPSNRYANNVTTFSDCVATCGDGCALVTYDYKTLECWALYLTPSTFEGDPYIAFRNFQAGSTQASSVKDLNSSTSAAVAAKSGTNDYGTYGWFRTPDAKSVGIQRPAPGRENFLFYQDCMDACDYDRACIGVMIEQRVPDLSNPDVQYNVAGPRSCMLVYANTRPGTNKRSVVRANIASVEIPQWTGVCREMPNDVIHGKWPTSCAGKPPGWVCQAECDCSPEECYSRDGCPITICIKKADGSVEWGPFSPPECTLAIPAQPPAISCPTPLTRNPPMPIWYSGGSRKRSLLGAVDTTPVRPLGSSSSSSSSRSLRSAPQSGLPQSGKAPGRSLQAWEWDPSQPYFRPYMTEFTSVAPFVSSLCRDPANWVNNVSPNDPFQFTIRGDGEPQGMMVFHDSGVCAQRNTQWFTGIAAQDFTTDGGPFKATRKWEQNPKFMHKSYVWTKFTVPPKPADYTPPDPGFYSAVFAQGIQVVVVGNVGTDHPCQANCAVTAVDVAIFENNRITGEPMLTKKPVSSDPDDGVFEEPWHTALVHLDHTNRNMSFNWQQNATAVLNFELFDRAADDYSGSGIALYENTTYWVRLRLVVPFNGTDDSGWARCYGYIGLAESAPIEPARWQEAGGYNSSCGPFGLDDFPVSGQTVGNCVNNGGVNGTTLEACTAAVTSQTCAVAKYGPDTPRSCPFGGQDILWSIWGNVDSLYYQFDDWFGGNSAAWGINWAEEEGGPDLSIRHPV